MTTKFSASRHERKHPSWCVPGMFPRYGNPLPEHLNFAPMRLNIAAQISPISFTETPPAYFQFMLTPDPTYTVWQGYQDLPSPTGYWRLAASMALNAAYTDWHITLQITPPNEPTLTTEFHIPQNPRAYRAKRPVQLAKIPTGPAAPWLITFFADG